MDGAVETYHGQPHGILRALACEEAGAVLGRAGRLEEAVTFWMPPRRHTKRLMPASISLVRLQHCAHSEAGEEDAAGPTTSVRLEGTDPYRTGSRALPGKASPIPK